MRRVRNLLRSDAVRIERVLVALLLVLIACDPRVPASRVYVEDFEQQCEGTPCGWERVPGTDGQVQWVETIHPGEHGLRLVGEARARALQPTPPSEDVATATGQFLYLRTVSRCDSASRISIEVLLIEPETNATVSLVADLDPPGEWGSSSSIDVARALPMTTTLAVAAVTIVKSGEGVCEVSEIELNDESFPIAGSGC